MLLEIFHPQPNSYIVLKVSMKNERKLSKRSKEVTLLEEMAYAIQLSFISPSFYLIFRYSIFFYMVSYIKLQRCLSLLKNEIIVHNTKNLST